MRNTIRITTSLTLLSLFTSALQAADEPVPTGPTFAGFVDTTYNYNMNRPRSGANLYHSFDPVSNTFALNNAQLLIQGNPRGDKDVSYTLRLDYGTDAKVIQGVGTPVSYVEVQEAYGTYVDPQTHLGVKIGKFVTFEGIEVIESIADPTITRGLLFGLAEPYTTTGGVVTYQVNDNLNAALGLVNGWDVVTDNNNSKTIAGYLYWKFGDTLALNLSGYYGPEKIANDRDNRLSIDLTGVLKVIKNLIINFQLNYGNEQKSAVSDPGKTAAWYGIGVQPVYFVTEKFSIGARVEYFDDANGARTGVDKQRLTTISISPGYQFTDHFLSRVEARIDRSNKTSFEDDKGVYGEKNQVVIAAQAIFSF